jgi:hypothetical protein
VAGEAKAGIREIGNVCSTVAAAVNKQGTATQEIARGVEVAAERAIETAKEVNLMGAATHDTHSITKRSRIYRSGLGLISFFFKTAGMWREIPRGTTRIASNRISTIILSG